MRRFGLPPVNRKPTVNTAASKTSAAKLRPCKESSKLPSGYYLTDDGVVRRHSPIDMLADSSDSEFPKSIAPGGNTLKNLVCKSIKSKTKLKESTTKLKQNNVDKAEDTKTKEKKIIQVLQYSTSSELETQNAEEEAAADLKPMWLNTSMASTADITTDDDLILLETPKTSYCGLCTNVQNCNYSSVKTVIPNRDAVIENSQVNTVEETEERVLTFWLSGGSCIETIVSGPRKGTVLEPPPPPAVSPCILTKKIKTLKELGITKRSFGQEHLRTLPREAKTDLATYIRGALSNGHSVDVQVGIAKHRFPCHWVILQCFSLYFKELGYKRQIMLDERQITPQGFHLAYHMLLPDSQVQLKHEELMHVFQAVNYLGINMINCECWAILDRTSAYQALPMLVCYADAKRLQLPSLESMLLARVGKLFLIFVATKQFVSMSYDEVLQLLQLSSLGVHDELQVLLSALRWLHYDWNNRSVHMLELMNCVRFSFISPRTLVKLNKGKELEWQLERVLSNEQVKSHACDGLAYACLKMHINPSGDESQKCGASNEKDRNWLVYNDGSPLPCYCKETCWKDNKIEYWARFMEHLALIKRDAQAYYKRLLSLPQTKPVACEIVKDFV